MYVNSPQFTCYDIAIIQFSDELLGGNPFGQGVAVPAVGADDVVVWSKGGADPGGNRLFP